MPEIQTTQPENNAASHAAFSEKQLGESVCVDTARVYDSCADKDCIANLRVYFTEAAELQLADATAIRCRGCEVLNVYSEIEKVPFNTGYYSVDNTFFFRLTLDVFTGPSVQPQSVCGLCVHSKKSILYGSEGSVKIFSSEYTAGAADPQAIPAVTNPRAKIQVATPICLDARFCRASECVNNVNDPERSIPDAVHNAFGGRIVAPEEGRAVRATIGLFSIVQLERDVQIMIPAYDFCLPGKSCSAHTEDPCEAFGRISFPVNEFFPPEQSAETADTPTFDCGCGK